MGILKNTEVLGFIVNPICSQLRGKLSKRCDAWFSV